MQDIEFTIERGKLFMLQTRTGKRTGAAAVKIACDMVKEKLITEKRRCLRIPAGRPHQLLLPSFDPAARRRKPCCRGLPASPGRGGRQAGFTADEAVERAGTPASRSSWSARRPAPRTSTACTRRGGAS
jgi:pyruvate,orthophosphate dikinase